MSTISSAERGTGQRWDRYAYPVATISVICLAIEILSRTGVLSPRAFPPVSHVGEALVRLAGEGAFWSQFAVTLSGWGVGLAVAAAIGVSLGMLLGSQALLYDALRILLEFIRPIPPIAILPLVVLLFGTGLQMRVLLVSFAALWPFLFQAMYGVMDVDPVARDVARGYGLNGVQRFFRAVLPSTLAYLATGLRLSLAVALSVTIAVEMIVGDAGLGAAMNQARYAQRPDVMYALVTVAGLTGLAANVATRRLERKVLHWHPSQREAVAS